MPDGTTYSFRANAFVAPRRYRLTDDALTWEEDGKPLDGVFYDDISEIRLAYMPTRAALNRYRAQIIFREGGMAELSNMDFVGFANFNALDDEYSAFIRELHRRLADRRAPTVYRTGTGRFAFAGNIALMIFVLAMIVVIALLLVSIGGTWIVMVKFFLVLFFLPFAIRYVRRSKPGTYDPRAIPDKVLPSPAPAASEAPA